ncbi:EF-hand domain-containing protein, partial [Novosphingobium piscinae]|uniref:EF-hand domain-containing protein n=1 Tax=Novosphingobium piscinae TaxID=1507448 RepID=UPI001FE627BC
DRRDAPSPATRRSRRVSGALHRAAAGRRLARLALAAPLALAAGSAVLAQPMGPMGPMADPYGDATVARQTAESQAAARFTALDANGDGMVTAEELRAGQPGGPDGPGGPGRDRPRRRGGDGGPGGGMARMLDADGDGKISREEFVGGSLRRFDLADANHDGQLTKAERDAAREAMRAQMEERMRAMMAGGMGGGDN